MWIKIWQFVDSMVFQFEEAHISPSGYAQIWKFGQIPQGHTCPTIFHSSFLALTVWRADNIPSSSCWKWDVDAKGKKTMHLAESVGSLVFAKDYMCFEIVEGNLFIENPYLHHLNHGSVFTYWEIDSSLHTVVRNAFNLGIGSMAGSLPLLICLLLSDSFCSPLTTLSILLDS